MFSSANPAFFLLSGNMNAHISLILFFLVFKLATRILRPLTTLIIINLPGYLSLILSCHTFCSLRELAPTCWTAPFFLISYQVSSSIIILYILPVCFLLALLQ